MMPLCTSTEHICQNSVAISLILLQTQVVFAKANARQTAFRQASLRIRATRHSLTGHAASVEKPLALSTLKNCKEGLNECWSQSQRAWAFRQQCQVIRHKCEKQLCTSWLATLCQHADSNCSKVTSMCKLSSQRLNMQTSSVDHVLLQTNESTPLLFIHIPKTAGTTIEDAAYAKGIRWGRFFMWGMVNLPDGNSCHAYHVPPRYFATPQDMYPADNAFCVVRHPFDRAVSEYKYLVSSDWGMKTRFLADQKPCTQEGLNSFLQQTLQLFLQGQRYQNDCHMVPQYEYIWGMGSQSCREVLRIEDFPASFNQLMSKYGFDLQLDDLTSTNVSPRCPQLSRENLTHDTRQMLELVYLEDLRLLNYTAS